MPSRERHAVREDQAFFQEFYANQRRFLFYCAGQYTSDQSLQEDLVQEVLVRLLRCIPTLRELNAARTASYLHTAMKSVYIDHCRRNSHTLPLEGGTLEARYISDASDEEIAGTLGCTIDSVRMLLSRARRRAKLLLADKNGKGALR